MLHSCEAFVNFLPTGGTLPLRYAGMLRRRAALKAYAAGVLCAARFLVRRLLKGKRVEAFSHGVNDGGSLLMAQGVSRSAPVTWPGADGGPPVQQTEKGEP